LRTSSAAPPERLRAKTDEFTREWEGSNELKITEKDVEHVAALANLELTAQETSEMTAHLDSILAYIEKLNELDTSKVEPMAQVLYQSPEKSDDVSALRADQDRESLAQELAVANALESGAGQFKVPKVIER
jgi:aspartyl-tRNA(Asn)/glutamyl-tRNA(Gln) amidotransferase subunit C